MEVFKEIKFDDEKPLKETIDQHFEHWWEQYGPRMAPHAGEDMEKQHAKRVALSAYQGGFCQGYFGESEAKLKRENEYLDQVLERMDKISESVKERGR